MTEDNTENLLTIELKDGTVEIELFPEDAPKRVERIKELAQEGLYDGVTFHRVMEGFMAQTGALNSETTMITMRTKSEPAVRTNPTCRLNSMRESMSGAPARWQDPPCRTAPTVNSLSVSIPLIFSMEITLFGVK